MKQHSPAPEPRMRKVWLGLLALALSGIAWWVVPGDSYPQAPAMAAIVTLMATCWITEVVPIPVTSLFPIVLLPAFGIMGADKVTAYYGKSTIFFFLGGFVLAMALQESNVHRRLALHVLQRVGTQPDRLVLGFMIATTALSMWVNNMATVMVMLPIALSVLEQSRRPEADPVQMRRFGAALMLGIAYAADIGGMATLVGTAPNMVYRAMLSELFPKAPPTEFLDWMKFGVPLAILFTGIGWWLMVRVIFPLRDRNLLGSGHLIADNLRALGPMRRDEWLTLGVFALAVGLWLTGSEIGITEDVRWPGWRAIAALKSVDDSVVAVGCALLLFLIPSGDRKGQALMTWEVANRLPWGILLLFGGGFAMAGGFEQSGLAELVGNGFQRLPAASPIFLIFVVCLLLTILTEFTSNTAITTLTLPILAKAAVAMGVDPRVLMIPATISASCAFMMPVASPTQAIVFGSGHVDIRQMMRGGVFFNLLGLVLVAGLFVLLAKIAFGIDIGVVPDWAKP